MKFVNTVFVRLSKPEYLKILNLSKGDTFYHFNLMHPHSLVRNDYKCSHKGVLILKNGSQKTDSSVSDPILDLERNVDLELLDIISELNFTDLNNIDKLILSDSRGVLESAYYRYNPVFGYTMDELKNLKYYVREFKII